MYCNNVNASCCLDYRKKLTVRLLNGVNHIFETIVIPSTQAKVSD